MITYFIVATKTEIDKMKSIEDVWNHIEQIKPTVGGRYSLEAITSLSKVLFQDKQREPIPTPYSLLDTSQFYTIDADFCEKLATSEDESLLDAAVPWSEDKSWKETDINPMDLAGFILELAALCKQVRSEQCLYILLSDED
jgi:hypothetical protein